MKTIINILFPKKSKWIDIYCFDNMGHYKLLQMRYNLSTNRKEFRLANMGFINDYTSKATIYENILHTPKAESK